MSPVIGILFCGFEKNRQFVTTTYIEAVSEAGAIPLIIPYPGKNTCSTKYFHICDGLLFCGGQDITPLLFGENLMTQKVQLTGKPIFSISVLCSRLFLSNSRSLVSAGECRF